VYIQLKEQVKHLIAAGKLRTGEVLPSGRALADNLHITRSTVLRAYQELEAEGFICSQHGKGVFVRGIPPCFPEQTDHEALLNQIDSLLTAARLRSIPLETIISLICKRFDEYPQGIAAGTNGVIFVECHDQPLRDYQEKLQEALCIDIEACLLADLWRPGTREKIDAAKPLVVTTFFHLREVQAALPDSFVFAINVEPHLTALTRLKSLPAAARIGVVCNPRETAEEMLDSLTKAGVRNLVGSATPEDPAELAGLAGKCTHFLVTSECAAAIDRLGARKPEILWFANRLDEASVSLLKKILKA